MKTYISTSFFLILWCVVALPVAAQQKIAWIDSNYILDKIPEVATVQQQVDQLAEEWKRELINLQTRVDDKFRDFQARRLLYTESERQDKQEEILRLEQQLEQARVRYFGPDGELFKKQEQLMRPIQERILTAVQEVSQVDGYDYVFDKSGDFLFLFAREEFNLSDAVLEELGIDPTKN